MDVSVLIPVFNAENFLQDSLMALRNGLDKKKIEYEILCLDDGSQDGSWHVLQQMIFEKGKVFRNENNQGLGCALRSLMVKADGDKLIYCDIDLPFGTEGVLNIIDELDHCDVVVASRYKGRRNYVSFVRKVLSRMYYGLCWMFFNVRVMDIGSGTVGFRKKVVSLFNLQAQGFEIHIELFAEAQRHQLMIHEIGMESRKISTGSFSIVKHGVGTVLNTLILWIKRWATRGRE